MLIIISYNVISYHINHVISYSILLYRIVDWSIKSNRIISIVFEIKIEYWMYSGIFIGKYSSAILLSRMEVHTYFPSLSFSLSLSISLSLPISSSVSVYFDFFFSLILFIFPLYLVLCIDRIKHTGQYRGSAHTAEQGCHCETVYESAYSEEGRPSASLCHGGRWRTQWWRHVWGTYVSAC